MRRKNWVIPGLLVLAMLLLLSFPGLAMAADNSNQTIGQGAAEVSAADDPPAQDAAHVPAIAKDIEPADSQSSAPAPADPVKADTPAPAPADPVKADTPVPAPADPVKADTPAPAPAEQDKAGNKPVQEPPQVGSGTEQGGAPGDTPAPAPVLVIMTKPVAPAPVAPAPVAPVPANPAPAASVRPASGHAAPGYVVQPGDTLDKISQKTGVPVDALKKANGLDIADNTVALPKTENQLGGTAGSGEEDGIAVENTVPPVMYRVRKGESLWLIGRNLGIDYRDIMEANHLTGDLIYPDQELAVPGLEVNNGMLKYRIKEGDTLYFIGKALGLNFEDIMSLNGIKDIWIYPDQVLQIPDKNQASVYRVRKGDTLADIAKKFGVGESNILGHEVSDGKLHVGQVLVIPKTAVVSRAGMATEAVTAAAGDLELLARTIYAEARGEVYEGQVAVGGVIMNRLKNTAFPKTIRDIIFQPGAFTSVDDGQINLTPDRSAYRAAQDALDGADPSLGAIYYWNPETAESKWIWSRPIIRQIGNHVFAR